MCSSSSVHNFRNFPTSHLFSFVGNYEVSIKFNDEHIPDSPFTVPVATLSDDASRLAINGLQVSFCVSVCV